MVNTTALFLSITNYLQKSTKIFRFSPLIYPKFLDKIKERIWNKPVQKEINDFAIDLFSHFGGHFMPKATLYEIAKLSGVSISTVSRVLNGDTKKPASKATAARVMQAAYDTGYLTPEFRGTEHKALLCLLSNRAYDYSDYFYSEILRGIEAEASAHGFHISQQLSDIGIDDAVLNDHFVDGYDGLILLGRVSFEKVEYLKSLTSNIVYAGLNRVDSGFDEVICDAYEAIQSTVDYLVDCGHTRIGFIGVIPTEGGKELVNEHRFAGFSGALARRDIALDMRYCKNVELKSEFAFEAAMELVKENSLPDALVCATDNVALGVISAFRKCGVRVPEDVSVVGHDGIDISGFFEPKLTTVYMQKSELGKFAVKLLVDRITGGHTIPVLIKLPHRLEVRDSALDRRLLRQG
ncbi:LacI family DNA-binding transcriptional regulator [uncultured Intestinimonas sp.]|uniref:LacI family DNA-binding transcriptional regulator n=1 Tax=uncultured Intestinimonas sp. TaxID=1689265 RepID=UPI0025E2446E|nr:LacI family DNA-binding transcriptional regulator [uncultured Intestinimonas sp.]